MVDTWLELLRGPVFRFAFLLMALGLARHVYLTGASLVKTLLRAGDKNMPWRQIFINTLKWLFPFKAINLQNRLWYSITSVLFHAGLILTPLFLGAHIMLWKRGIGLSWPALSQGAADFLTLLTIVTGIGLIIGRAAHPASRRLSRFQDFALPPLLLIPFITGFLAMHPWWHPIPYKWLMLVHFLSADLIFILIPFTKMAHCILLPFTQFVSEAGWHFPPDSGEKVAIALNKETEPV